MKLKKITTIMLLIAILFAQISILKFSNFVLAEENVSQAEFYYLQLDNVSKKIYDGLYEMYNQGILMTGTQSFDLSKNNEYITQEQLQNYMKGDKELVGAMKAAKYAFYADHPEVFYVDFQKLTLRVTKDTKNKYHAKIGSGNLEDYYIEGFTNEKQVNEALTEFNNKVNEIADKANKLEVESGKNIQVEKIKYIHNEIIKNTGYRLESDCKAGNQGFISTPYGALVKGQAVCEGYARALKAVLDKVGMESIIVQGVHQAEGSAAVSHMWNYVKVDNIWYAIDATLDDPFNRNVNINKNDPSFKPGDDIIEGYENTRYCLVGTETLNKEHIPIETVQVAGLYIFKYPELSVEDYGINTVVNANGLLVKYKQEGTQTEEYEAGDYYVSYNNKGYAENVKEGKYILMKSYQYAPVNDSWVVGNWAYFLPDMYVGGFKDNGDHLYITMPNSEYVEFAVTTLAPGDYKNNPIYLYYQGNESDFVAKTEKLYNPSGTYKSKPYIISQEPSTMTDLTVGKTYHVDVSYDDILVPEKPGATAGYKMESTGTTGAEESKITNFQFDGKNRITFDITFSKMFADDGAFYKIYITGLVGKNSGKAPIEITYGAAYPILCANQMDAAKSWDVFGTPTLLENQDLSMSDWKTSDGSDVSDLLKNRIALVTTKTTKAEKETMENLMKNEQQDQEILSSQTYNISLNVCKKYIIKTGHKIRFSVGFPAGYGPEDEGVTFKAYHFKRDNNGNITEVEEIPCVVTKYGLVITCDSFSPFAIAAVEDNEESAEKDRNVIVSTTEGGSVEGINRNEGDILTLKKGEEKEITVKADNGFQIEKIEVCGVNIQIKDNKTMKVKVGHDDITNLESIIKVTFVAESVAQNDILQGEFTVTPEEVIRGFEVAIENKNNNVDLQKLQSKDEFEVNINAKNFNNMGKGIIVLAGQLEYDSNILERISITGQNGWTIEDDSYVEETNQFIAENNEYVCENSDILTIKFRVKDTATEPVSTTIKIKKIVSSGGYGVVKVTNAELPISIIKYNPTVEKIKSEVYHINDTEKDITKIMPGTTISEFKEKIETENITKDKLLFTNKEGKSLNDNSILNTGDIIKVGESLQYTIIVKGDINGESYINDNKETEVVDTDDLAKIKLHYLEKEKMTGIGLKAADYNENGIIDVDDIACIKLIILGLTNN